MELIKADRIANALAKKLQPFCDRVEVAGSIRRRKPEVKDIDIVAIPNENKIMSRGFFDTRALIAYLAAPTVKAIGPNGLKLASFRFKHTPVDIYWATEETWHTLLLIRTGSKEHNIKLATLAKQKGMHLHANGEGLFFDGNRIAGDSEESIFNALGIPYLEPERRT